VISSLIQPGRHSPDDRFSAHPGGRVLRNSAAQQCGKRNDVGSGAAGLAIDPPGGATGEPCVHRDWAACLPRMNTTPPAAVPRTWPALLPVLFFVPWVLAPPLNHDVAAVLSFSQRWLAGERLYVDLIDVNPPLIYLLNLLPTWLARATGIDAVIVLQACLLAWGAAVWALALGLRDPAIDGPVERLLLAVLPGLFVFSVGYDFGQRDPLMAASALPYVYAAARRARGEAPRGRIAAAVLAAVGFALKPYFLGIPALVELAVLVGCGPRRWLSDPVPWIMAALWAVYLAALPLAFPDYLSGVLPLVWSLYLTQTGLGPLDMLMIPQVGAAVLLLVPLLWPALRPTARPGAALPRLLALAALGGLASAVAQRKGWSYHVAPLELFTLALTVVLAARLLDSLQAARRFAAAGLVALLGLAFVVWSAEANETPWNELTYGDSDAAGLTALLKRTAKGQRVLVLSPQVAPIFPALNYAHATLALRTMNMWMVEGSYRSCPTDGRRYHDVGEMPATEAFFFRAVAEDFARAPPAAVIVDRYPGIPDCNDVTFDYITYFSRNPLFAETWSHYRPVAEWGRFRLFTRAN